MPRVDEAPRPSAGSAEAQLVGGSETVLLVEDDERVRAAIARMLGDRGYEVIAAHDGAEAIEKAFAHEGTIALVISDVVMPTVGGLEAVTVLQVRFPELKALFMSGHTDHALLRDDVLRGGANFLQKPFSPTTLARKVRDVLDATPTRPAP